MRQEGRCNCDRLCLVRQEEGRCCGIVRLVCSEEGYKGHGRGIVCSEDCYKGRGHSRRIRLYRQSISHQGVRHERLRRQGQRTEGSRIRLLCRRQGHQECAGRCQEACRGKRYQDRQQVASNHRSGRPATVSAAGLFRTSNGAPETSITGQACLTQGRPPGNLPLTLLYPNCILHSG